MGDCRTDFCPEEEPYDVLAGSKSKLLHDSRDAVREQTLGRTSESLSTVQHVLCESVQAQRLKDVEGRTTDLILAF